MEETQWVPSKELQNHKKKHHENRTVKSEVPNREDLFNRCSHVSPLMSWKSFSHSSKDIKWQLEATWLNLTKKWGGTIHLPVDPEHFLCSFLGRANLSLKKVYDFTVALRSLTLFTSIPFQRDHDDRLHVYETGNRWPSKLRICLLVNLLFRRFLGEVNYFSKTNCWLAMYLRIGTNSNYSSKTYSYSLYSILRL